MKNKSKMKSIALVFVLFGFSLNVAAQTVTCDNYKEKVILWEEGFDSGKKVNSGDQPRVLWLTDFLKEDSLRGVPSTLCEETFTEMPACMVDVYEPTIYDNGIVWARGQSNDYIWFHNDFPTTPLGVRFGMSKSEVLRLLGPARWEGERRLQYDLTSNHRIGVVNLLFEDDRLSFILLVNWKGECQEH